MPMRPDLEWLANISRHFEDAGTAPPLKIALGVAALAADTPILHPVSSFTAGGNRSAWSCMALVGQSILSVEGFRAGDDWHLGGGYDEPEEPTVYGSLTLVSEVTACRLLEIDSAREYWLRWQLQLRSGDSLQIPWPTADEGRQRHEALAAEVTKQLR
jgi:hypothetical protein